MTSVPQAADAYTRRFGYERSSSVIHDPVQTAFVQFLRLRGDSCYLELVAPDGPDSKLSNALCKGGGLHHFCYATSRLEALCERLRGEGLVLIQKPLPAVAFGGRRIAWLMGRDRVLVELLEGSVVPGADLERPPS